LSARTPVAVHKLAGWAAVGKFVVCTHSRRAVVGSVDGSSAADMVAVRIRSAWVVVGPAAVRTVVGANVNLLPARTGVVWLLFDIDSWWKQRLWPALEYPGHVPHFGCKSSRHAHSMQIQC